MHRKITICKLTALAATLALLAGTTLLIGCQEQPDPTTTSATTEQTTQTAATTAAPTTTGATAAETTQETETAPEPVLKNQLTGLLLANPEAEGRRPIAIMINNHRQGVPQIGIGEADLLFEMLVEGGITRLMAVFADVSAVPETGSIRSARHNYIDLAGGLDAIMVHVGGSNLANDQFARQKTEHLDLHVYSSAYWRDPDWSKNRGYEHSVKTNAERLVAGLQKSKFRTDVRDSQGMAFNFRSAGDVQPAGQDAALEVRVPFADYTVATFTYNSDTGLYNKGQFGRDHIDLASGQALQFTNVILVMTRVGNISGSVLRDIDLEAGQGYYISGGQYQAISWRKGQTADKLVFYDDQNNELLVNAGKSYIGIVPKSAKVTFGN